MSPTAIPVTPDVEQDAPPTDADLLRRRAIPVEAPEQAASSGTPIPMGSTDDLESRGLQSHMAARPIPVAPAPQAPEAGSTEDLENKSLQSFENPHSAPIQTGVSALWAKAKNIHNPVLRVLGEIGAGGARALDAVGTGVGRAIPLAGLAESAIPGSTLNQEFKQGQQNRQDTQDAKLAEEGATTAETKTKVPLEQAQTRNENAEAAQRENPQAKPDKPETPQQVLAGIEAEDLDKGTDPTKDPRVQQVSDTITGLQKPSNTVAPLTADQAKQRNAIWNPILAKNHLPTDVFTEGMTDADAKELAAQLNNATGKTQAGVKIDMGSGDKNQGRSDKSYTYNSDKLDKLGKPIEDAVGRMGRLRDTLAQGTPQADALIAPELLTIMAGGQGSGLRMNEAEIQRIVGGRSKWESLKAAINQWSLDPSKANSITSDQRQEIHALVDGVNAKLQKKQQALDAAREALLDSDDPKEHRRIVTEAHHSLTKVDEGAAEEPERPARVPKEYVYQENGPKGKGWYKPTAVKQ